MISVKVHGPLRWSDKDINLCNKIGKVFLKGMTIDLKPEQYVGLN